MHSEAGFKGVSSGCLSRATWRARITAHGKTMNLGFFVSREDAARAYDDAARELFGAFACVNFPHDGERGALL